MINAPPIGPMAGKFWGKTRCIFSNDTTEIWEINIDKGGFCSEHFHDDKWNRFFISKGRLRVTIFLDGDDKERVDETIMVSGDIVDVPPGMWHMFEALEDVEGIEVYWVDLSPMDITRRTQGGMRDGS